MSAALISSFLCLIIFILIVTISFNLVATTQSVEITQDKAISSVNYELRDNYEDIDDSDEIEFLPTYTRHLKMKSLNELSSEYWLKIGIQHVLHKMNDIQTKTYENHARNIIFFIGDGMSLTTLAAARIYLGGEEQSLSFEKFAYTGLARTYTLDRLVPDSAAAATALLCGVKTKYGFIGLDGTAAKRTSCDATTTKTTTIHAAQITSIADWALRRNKWTGFVTTARVTDATPAALYAHTTKRAWENDEEDLKKVCGTQTQIEDIGLQLMNGTIGARLKVILGGGSAQLQTADDGRNLISEFKANQQNIFVTSKTESNWLHTNLSEDGRFLGLFSKDYMPYNLEMTNEVKTNIPSLEEMTAKAIEILQEKNEGFFLMVEAGKIDVAHHENKAKLAVDETVELSKAVTKALEMTNERETLIVVTADHGQTMTLAGYNCRSCDVFGSSDTNAIDDLPYKFLSYANGPGYRTRFRSSKSNERLNRNEKSKTTAATATNNINEKNFEVFPAAAPLDTATHGGEDVPVYANGPWAHLFSGVYDQSTIPHLMAFAGCLNKGEEKEAGEQWKAHCGI